MTTVDTVSGEGLGDQRRRPEITGSAHALPFHALDPGTFERLCLWLVRAEGFRGAEHYGAAGSDAGRDVLGWLPTSDGGAQLWYFQCKRRARTRSAELISDADRAHALAAGQSSPPRPVGMIFVLSGPLSAKVRDKVRAHLAGLGLECGFWASTELDAMVKGHPALLAEFFRLPQPDATRFPTPRRLPRAPLGFVNRERELADLDAALEEASTAVGPVVAVLSGMHGVGKSAAGNHWAHRHRMRFAQGDLYGDFSRRRHGSRVDPSNVLADFLRDLGTGDDAIPSSFEQRRRLFELMTADRRILMLLDDVEEPAQVLSLLPTGAGSVVLVTSNHRLHELLYEGARSVPLEPLDGDAARLLLARMVGDDRISLEFDSTETLVQMCAGLPIVLSVAAGRLASDRGRSVAWLVDRISHAPRVLAALSGRGSYAADAVFDFAYRDLDPGSALTYRRLGVHPGLDLTVPVAAVVSDQPVSDAEATLETLYDAHLITTPAPGRYRLHELIRDHSRDCLDADEDAAAAERATARLVDWYLAALRHADRAVVADRIRLSDDLQLDVPYLPTITTPAEAFAWFEPERANVLAVLQVAFDREWDERVWQIAETLWPLCASHKFFAEWVGSHTLAVASARRLGNSCVEARFCSQLARAHAERQEHELAARLMQEAHAAARTCGNDLLRASVTEFGGVCLLHAGAPLLAARAFKAARRMFAAQGRVRGVALQDLYLGTALVRLHKNAAALSPLGDALDVLTMTKDEISVARVLLQRGEALAALRRTEEARADLAQAIVILSDLGIVFEQAAALETLAEVEQAEGKPELTQAHRQRAYELYRGLGHPRAEELLLTLSQGSAITGQHVD